MHQHHIKLLFVIKEARQKHKSLAVCWLDLANAFGSVHQQLSCFSLEHYLAPASMVAAVSDLYRGLVGIALTKTWSSNGGGCFPRRSSLCDHLLHSHEHTCGHHHPVSPPLGLFLVQCKLVLKSPPVCRRHLSPGEGTSCLPSFLG